MAAIQDATLVVQALHMAIARRRPQAGLLHHADRGSTYTSESYQALLQQEGMIASMSRTADCYDHAARESFFHRFKGECIDGQSFQTRAQARSSTFDSIETFSNRTRRHSTLHYLSPLAYEQLMCSSPCLGSPLIRVKITIDLGVAMDIRTFTELTTPDERSLRFTPLGLATGGKLGPENAAEFQQRSIAAADLVPAVPEGTRSSFERLRTLHAYGVLCYDLFTVVDDLTWIVLEQALRERFIEFYGGVVPLVGKDGAQSMFSASDFEAISEAFRQGGSHAGWRLRLRTQGTSMRLPLTLGPLLRWARQEQLLHGQRNRRVEEDLFNKIRNRFAHGGGFRVGMPNQSARRIRDLAEIINRLWGRRTPGGRLYPAPLQREVLIIGWSPTWSTREEGSSLEIMHVGQLTEQEGRTTGCTSSCSACGTTDYGSSTLATSSPCILPIFSGVRAPASIRWPGWKRRHRWVTK